MKRYKVIDLQGASFLDYTEQEPETAQQLRSHFWSFDEARTTEYKYFTLDYIKEVWSIDLEEVKL